MTRIEFVLALQDKLKGLPKAELLERIEFYNEMIADRMEDGLSEEEAVAAVGPVEKIAAQIITDIPLVKIAKEKIKAKKSIKAWEIVLLALGSPIWVSLGIAAVAVILSVYIVLWSVIISLWAIFAAVIGCSLGGFVSGVGIIVYGSAFIGIAMLGVGIFCTGFSILTFYGCRAATKGILILTKKVALCIKNCFIKREVA